MAFLTGQNFGARLIEALGLQHQNVRAITLHCRIDDVAYHLARRHAGEHVVTLTTCRGTTLGVWFPNGTTLARATPENSWCEGRWRAEA